MSRVYFVRHAVHDLVGVALAGRMPGVTLSAAGRAQAQGLADHFAGVAGVGRVLSSPLERCRETAAAIAERLVLPVTVDEALNELDCGAWTGKTFAALADDPRWHVWNSERARATVPGGETAAAVATRIMGLLAQVAAEDGVPTVLVTHSDVVKVALLSLLQAPLDLHDRLEIEPASITTVDLWPGGGKVVRSNAGVAA